MFMKAPYNAKVYVSSLFSVVEVYAATESYDIGVPTGRRCIHFALQLSACVALTLRRYGVNMMDIIRPVHVVLLMIKID